MTERSRYDPVMQGSLTPTKNTDRARRRGQVSRVWALTLSMAFILAACGTAAAIPAPAEAPAAPTTEAPAPAPTTTVAEAPATEAPTTTIPADLFRIDAIAADMSAHSSIVALALGDTDVYNEPDETSSMMTMPATTILGTDTVFGVIEVKPDGWALVSVPIRPNGTTGWVRIESVELYVVDGQIVVDLTARTLTYYVDGEEVLKTEIAIGTSRNSTPTGHFFVTDSVTLSIPNSPWGPAALGISAYSDTITEYNGGPGIIGIHGTNKPSSIGQAASLGCVRLPNELITLLHALVPIGTPVEIRA